MTRKLLPFVIVCRDDDAWLVGPFASRRDARRWARANWDVSTGYPPWQVLRLPSAGYINPTPSDPAGFLLPVHAPDSRIDLI